MKTVYKYPLDLSGINQVDMPQGAEILSVQVQGRTPQMYALGDPARPIETRQFRIVGTGHPIERDDLHFIDTIQVAGGALVFHVFEITSKEADQ